MQKRSLCLIVVLHQRKIIEKIRRIYISLHRHSYIFLGFPQTKQTKWDHANSTSHAYHWSEYFSNKPIAKMKRKKKSHFALMINKKKWYHLNPTKERNLILIKFRKKEKEMKKLLTERKEEIKMWNEITKEESNSNGFVYSIVQTNILPRFYFVFFLIFWVWTLE